MVASRSLLLRGEVAMLGFGNHGHPRRQSRHRSWSHLKIVIGLVIFFVVVFSVFASWIIDLRFTPVIEGWAIQRATNLAQRAISNAIGEITADQIEASELVTLEKNSQESVSVVQFNFGAINKIVSKTTQSIQDSLNTMKDEVLPIPMGQVTGIRFLAGLGPRISVKIIPVGAVNTIPRQEFIAQGINQTLYKLYLEVKTNLRIVVPFIDTNVEVRDEVTIATVIIPGEVPSVYFNLNGKEGFKQLQELQIPSSQ